MRPRTTLLALALCAAAAAPAAAQGDADAESRAVVEAALRQVETYYGPQGRSRPQDCRESAQGLELDLLRDPSAIVSRQRRNRGAAELVGPTRLPVPICFRPHVARVDQQVDVLTRFDSLLFARAPDVARRFVYVLGFAQPAERDAQTLACDRAAAVLNRFDAPLRDRFTAARWGSGLSDVQVRQRRVVFRESPQNLVPPELRRTIERHVDRSLTPCPT